MAEHYLKGAKWSLKNSSFEYGGVLDEKGGANLKDIVYGTYTFTLSKDGYITKEETIEVRDAPINIEADLEPVLDTKKKTSKKETEKPKKTTTTKKRKTTTKKRKTTTKKEETAETKEESKK